MLNKSLGLISMHRRRKRGGWGGFSPPNFWKILLTDRFLPAKTHEKVDWAPQKSIKWLEPPPHPKIIPPPLFQCECDMETTTVPIPPHSSIFCLRTEIRMTKLWKIILIWSELYFSPETGNMCTCCSCCSCHSWYFLWIDNRELSMLPHYREITRRRNSMRQGLGERCDFLTYSYALQWNWRNGRLFSLLDRIQLWFDQSPFSSCAVVRHAWDEYHFGCHHVSSLWPTQHCFSDFLTKVR